MMPSPNSRDDRYDYLINHKSDSYNGSIMHDSYGIQLGGLNAPAPMGQYATGPALPKYNGSSTTMITNSPDLKSHGDMEHQQQQSTNQHTPHMTKAELRKVIMIN